MYKSKLQVLCQHNSWGLPDYYTTKDGPDHSPLFKATVIVNGVLFVTDDQYRTAKCAQNEVAKLAFDQLSAPPSPPPLSQYQLSVPPPRLPQHQLSAALPPPLPQYQLFAPPQPPLLPQYLLSGPPPPLPQFLTLNCSLNSLQRSPIAEGQLPSSSSSAAKVVWESLSLNEVEEDNSTVYKNVYKNLLQELAERKGLLLPKYVRSVSGPPHLQIFISTVEIRNRRRDFSRTSSKEPEVNRYECCKNSLQLPSRAQTNMNFPNGATVLSIGDDKWVTLKMKMN